MKENVEYLYGLRIHYPKNHKLNIFLCFIIILFQGAQAVGMGQEAHKVPAAAELYNKANEILW